MIAQPDENYYQMASAMIFQVPSEENTDSADRAEREPANQQEDLIRIKEPLSKSGSQQQYALPGDSPKPKTNKSSSKAFLFSNEHDAF